MLYHELSKEKYGWAYHVTGFLMQTSEETCLNQPFRLERTSG